MPIVDMPLDQLKEYQGINPCPAAMNPTPDLKIRH